MKNNLSRYLAYVREGGEIVVLDRDTPVARVIPFARSVAGDEAAAHDRFAEERLESLEREGTIARGDAGRVREWLATSRPVKLPRGSGSVLRALLEARAEDAR